MTKRTARVQRTQAENSAGPAPMHLVEPMLAGMTSTRQHLLAWVHAQGLAALDELFRDEAVALAGPKGRHQPPRTHHHWGTAATELTFGGRRVQVGVLRQNRVRPARANVRAVLTARKKLRIRREAKVVGILWPST